MADYIKMPTLGFDMEEGTMGGWLKNVGDAVAKGDILAEIESDKVTQELQARSEGVLLAIFANEGDNVPVGANLGIIGAAGEDISSMTNGDSPAPAAPAATPEPTPAAAPAQETAVSTPTPTPVPTPVAEPVD